MATACLLTAGRAGSDYPRLVPTWQGTKRDEQSTSAPTPPCRASPNHLPFVLHASLPFPCTVDLIILSLLLRLRFQQY